MDVFYAFNLKSPTVREWEDSSIHCRGEAEDTALIDRGAELSIADDLTIEATRDDVATSLGFGTRIAKATKFHCWQLLTSNEHAYVRFGSSLCENAGAQNCVRRFFLAACATDVERRPQRVDFCLPPPEGLAREMGF